MLSEKREQEKKLANAILENDSKEERAALGATLAKLRDEINEIEAAIKDADKPVDNGNGSKDGNVIVEDDDDVIEGDNRRSSLAVLATEKRSGAESRKVDAEKRAKAFKESNTMQISNKEARAVLVASGQIATPTEVSGIVDGFGGVSSIVDLVKVTDASGMGAYKVAYEVSGAEAGAQGTNAISGNPTNTEGGAYHESTPTYDFVTITPDTKTVLSYISKQVQKQTPLNYEAKVRESALSALKKSAAALITSKILASSIVSALEIGEAIDDKTLRKIALNYGSDDTVVGGAVLFLNKSDLIAFGDVRGTNEKMAVYEITPDTSNPNTGIIKDGGLSVKYCIDSNLTAGTMIYGQPQNCELALFSDYDIRVSEDFAFDRGMLAIRGDVELGADVVKNHGFIVTSLGSTAHAGNETTEGGNG
jgi:HK97 family phage major capsid protein